MATGSYDQHSLIMRLEPKLLEKLAERFGLPFKMQNGEEEQERAERFFSILKQQDESRQGYVWGALNEVSDLSGHNGVDFLINSAIMSEIKLDEKAIGALPNGSSRSLWFYLNHPEIFNRSVDQYNIDNQGSWKSVVLPLDDVGVLKESVEIIREAVQMLFAQELKGTRCQALPLEPDDKRLCIVLYIEDRLTADLLIKDDKIETEKPRRPLFRAYIQYLIEDGVLEVKIKGGQPKVEALQKIIVEDVLGKNLAEHTTNTYDLDVLRKLNPNPLVTDPEDRVKFVQLKTLRLVNLTDQSSLYLTIGNSPIQGTDQMRELLQQHNVNLDHFDIALAIIKIIFHPRDGKQKKVTVQVNHSKGHNLKSRKQDMWVRALLKKWKIDVSDQVCTKD